MTVNELLNLLIEAYWHMQAEYDKKAPIHSTEDRMEIDLLDRIRAAIKQHQEEQHQEDVIEAKQITAPISEDAMKALESFARSVLYNHELLKSAFNEMNRMMLEIANEGMNNATDKLIAASFLTRWYWRKRVVKWKSRIDELSKTTAL